MDVILLERVEKLGRMGDVVKVKPGYARNFLLPRGKALRATPENLARFEADRARLEAENARRREAAEAEARALDGLAVVLVRQAANTGALYGSVSARDVAEALHERGHRVARSAVVLDRPIKTLGLHPVRLVLHPEVSVSITVNVARSVEEADLQAQGVDPTALERQEGEGEAEGTASLA
ncbi:MAG: 50S ribosomal protein L9 [Thermaurantiacus sp.]|uniref:50S ribosomal protein L9 n=1 Tax=Thermaurantiacus sp. TaxID=2820283 RepID=UPI00298EE5E9|nr:50S ribosomal protein L9 [Thermaurantiacus sp.]MDW8415844.1 50S ribosomal protein L9 [Thermaurantiacus sp.]